MKKFLLFLSPFLIASHSFATHLSYIDISYNHISGLTYEFTITVYEECGVNVVSNQLTVNACTPSGCAGPISNNIICNLDTSTGQIVYPTCAYLNTNCVTGPDIGFRKWIYRGNKTLTSNCPDFIFTVEVCCRPSPITNILNPLNTGMGVEARLDNFNVPNNNSPVFNDEPVIFVCCNQLFSYNQSATDIDGDSLMYSLYNPISTFTNCSTAVNITYLAPFSFNSPFSSSPPASINPSTGYLTVNPTNCFEESVIGIKVDEYRNGNWIGSVMRDTRVIITNQLVGVQNKNQETNNISIYPNPASSNFTIEGLNKAYNLKIYNALGQLLYSENNVLDTYNKVDVSKLSKGLLFIRIKSDDEVYLYKVVKE